MSVFKPFLAAAAVALALPMAADAAVLKSAFFDYGNDFANGEIKPPSDDPVGPNFVRVRDTPTSSGYNQFVQVLDLSDVMGTITSIDVEIIYTGIATIDPEVDPDPGEKWSARVLGADNSSILDDEFVELPQTGPSTGTLSFTIDASTDTASSTTAFAGSVASDMFRLRFREESSGADNFRLFSSEITVNGVAPIPLPASGMLLLGALGGAAALRRRKAAK